MKNNIDDLSNKKINLIVADIENNFDVCKLNYMGILIWPIIKIHIATNLQKTLAYGECTLSKKQTIGGIIKKIAGKFYFEVFNNLMNSKKFSKVDVLFFSRSMGRLKFGRNFYNYYTDPLLEKLKENRVTSYTIENSDENKVYIRTRYPVTFVSRISKLFHLKKRILKLLKSKKNKTSNSHGDIQRIEDIYEHVYKKYLIEIPRLDIERMIINIKIYKSLFLKILKKTNPKMGIVVCWYNYRGMAFCLACKELGIKVADIQHGVQGEYHVAYNAWFNQPKNGYDLLPDLFLNWNINDSIIINKWGKNYSHNAISIGNTWHEKWKNEDKAICFYINKIRKIIDQEYYLTGLYTLQDKLPPEWFFDIIEMTGENIFWWIRSHPGHGHIAEKVKEKLSNLNVDNYNIDDASTLPLPALLRAVNFHMTGYSSVVNEMLEYNKVSFITDATGFEYYQDLIKKGFAVVVKSPVEFIDLIKNNNTSFENKTESASSDLTTLLEYF